MSRRGPGLGRRALAAAVAAGALASCSTGSGEVERRTPPRLNETFSVIQPPTLPPPSDDPGRGVDISYPQCGRPLRDIPSGFVIVGLNGGKPLNANPCFRAQWEFAGRQSGRAIYVNTADPGRGDPATYAVSAVNYDLKLMKARGIERGTPVWLDVETLNTWRGGQARHRIVLQTMLEEFVRAGHPVGFYAARVHWAEITGGVAPGVPVWLAIGAAGAADAQSACGRAAFGAARPDIVQRIGSGSDGKPLDRNLVCSTKPGALRGMVAGA